MGKVTFKVNYPGLESDKYYASGYEMEESETTQRAKVSIRASSVLARLDNSKNNTLLKALGGGK